MKIASCTGGFRNLSFPETLAILDELGFEYVEGTTDGRAHLYPYVFGEKDVSELARLLSQFRVKLIAISGGWSDFAVADRYLDAQYESLHQQFALCRLLGIGILRIFASHIPGQYLGRVVLQRVIRNVKRVVPDAESSGIHLVMENHYGITATADDLLRILDGVSSPWLQANFDPANFIPMEEDPVRACQRLLPYIGHVHLKDARYTGTGPHNSYEYCEFGAGILDYRSILSTLFESGYAGVLSIEYETFDDVVRGTVVARRNLRELMIEMGCL